MGSIFFEITIIICLASALAILFRLLKQPTILAYILTGIIVGPFGQLQFQNQEVLQSLGELGITFLLFMLGLELQLSHLRSIGKNAITLGSIQILFSFFISYLLAIGFGLGQIQSLYIGIALTFSSTIIVVKLLSDKKDLNSLYGKIAVGILLFQDLFAVLALVLLSGFAGTANTFSAFPFVLVFLKACLIFGAVLYLSKSIFPKVVDLIARSQETLFLVSIAWVFGMAALVSAPPIGFSIEIGGLLAGLALANTTENFQILARVRALRDFFITLFFVFLGTKMAFLDVSSIFIPAVVFSLFILFGKPFIIMLACAIFGYRKRTAFLSGISLSQISEFSLIIIFLGNKLGHVSNEVVSLVTLVSIITFAVSSYAIARSNSLYRFLQPYLGIFEIKRPKREEIGDKKTFKNHIVLVGANRVGQSILDSIKDLSEKIVVVDFDPDIIRELKEARVDAFFGDITDLEIQEIAQIASAKLIVSTVSDFEDNLLLVKGIRHENQKIKIIVVAQDQGEAEELYRGGVDYVVLPHLAGGRHIAKILSENNIDQIGTLREKDLKALKPTFA